MSKQVYAKYKSSNIDWIGNIPLEWKIVKVKNAFNRKKKSAMIDNPIILSLTSKGVIVRDISTNDGQIAESYDNYNLVNIGDLLLNPMDLVTNAFSALSPFEGVISPAYFNLKNNKDINSKYYDYYFKLQYWDGTFFAHGKGVSAEHRRTLNNETLMNYPIPMPNFAEQESIVQYLDGKIAKIDEAIYLKQQQIELLKERKIVLINQAIIRGLDFEVETVESGIEWIGKIPKNWGVRRLRFLTKKPLQYGANESANEDNPNYPRYVRITDIDENNNLREDTFKSLPPVIAQHYLLEDGDLLFARSGATVGKTFQYKKSRGTCCYAGYLIKFSCDKEKINTDYLNFVTKSNMYNNRKNSIFIQATIQNISAEKYKNLVVPLPGLKEQEEIVTYLESNVSQLEITISTIERSIDLLAEYKHSLISHVVTGKVKVF